MIECHYRKKCSYFAVELHVTDQYFVENMVNVANGGEYWRSEQLGHLSSSIYNASTDIFLFFIVLNHYFDLPRSCLDRTGVV